MKSVFISGGTSGIGWDLAKLYLQEGCRVGVCGRDLSKLPDNVEADFPKLVTYTLDVRDKEKSLEVISEFAKGGLDIVVANAGISHGSKNRWPSEEATRNIFDINLYGTINILFPAMEIFKKQKSGHIVTVASVAGFVGLPGASAYSASKGALIHLMESYSLSLGDFGIKTTTICPGFIDTPLTKKNDHDMPFIMPSLEGAKKIKNAIEKGKVLYVFPWQMALVIHILRRIPRWLYRKIMSSSVANYSK